MSRERIVYQEKYRPGSMVFPPNQMPGFVHLANGFVPVRLELRSVAKVVVDGVEMEFQDLRLYVKEKK